MTSTPPTPSQVPEIPFARELLLVTASAASLIFSTPLSRAEYLNLTLYQTVTADSTNGSEAAVLAVDGIVANDRKWTSATTAQGETHSLEISWPVPVTLGCVHVYSGIDDTNALSNFSIQTWNGQTWDSIPGATLTNNTSVFCEIILAQAVATSRLRLSTTDSTARIKEVAAFPPNRGAGYPFGAGVNLNLAADRPVVGSSIEPGFFPKLAVDGHADSLTGWQTASSVVPHTLEVDLQTTSRIAGFHLHSGGGTIVPTANFAVESWDGSTWQPIPYASVAGNTHSFRAVALPSAISATKVRLLLPDAGPHRIREFSVRGTEGRAFAQADTNASATSPPSTSFETYSDSFYTLKNYSNSQFLAHTGNPDGVTFSPTSNEAAHYQILLNVGTDTYRIRHRVTGRCLEPSFPVMAEGSPVILGVYSGLTQQNWRLAAASSGRQRLVNARSGLSLGLDSGSRLIQSSTPGNSVEWTVAKSTHYPKKGVGGWTDRWPVNPLAARWGYNWSRDANVTLPVTFPFMPMQWGAYWPGFSSLPQGLPTWNARARPTYLLGFNEPDGATQANMSVDWAISLWPRLEQTRVPLVSPVAVTPTGTWMTSYMAEADRRGYRTDAVAVHWYGSPNGGDPGSFISWLQGVNTRYGRPVWITEFSTVDWSGTGSWSENDNYNFLAEFLWRAEDLSWLSKYAIFVFSGDPPSSPSAAGPPGVRSNFHLADKTTFTPFGELYAAWDADRTLRADTAYFVHNRSTRKRLKNVGTSTASFDTIRVSTAETQWMLKPTPTSGRWYLESSSDGRRLAGTSSTVSIVAAGTTGTTVEWRLNNAPGNGWNYIELVSSGKRLRNTSTTIDLTTTTATGSDSRWRFIKPLNPVGGVPTALPLVALPSPANAGTVSGNGSYPPGSAATLQAIPLPGFVFSHWQTPEGNRTENPLSYPVPAYRELTAIFNPDPADTDGNGRSAYGDLMLQTEPDSADPPAISNFEWYPNGINGGNGSWENHGTNWRVGTLQKAWTPGQRAFFSGISGSVDVTEAIQDIKSIVFTAANYSLSGGGPLELADSCTLTSSAGTTKIQTPLLGSGSFVINGGFAIHLAGNNQNLSGTIMVDGNTQLRLYDTNSNTASGAEAGKGGLTIDLRSGSQLRWYNTTGSPTYPTDFRIRGTGYSTNVGVLNNDSGLGNPVRTVTLDGSIVLDDNATIGTQNNGAFVVNGQVIGPAHTLTILHGAAPSSLNGPIQLAGLQKTGNGNLVITSQSPAIDSLAIRSGTVEFQPSINANFDGDTEGAGSLIKSGNRILTVTGVLGHSGGSVVQAGGLDLSGSIASNLEIQANAALGGSGVIDMNATIVGRLDSRLSRSPIRIRGRLALDQASLSLTGPATEPVHIIAYYGSLTGGFADIQGKPANYQLDMAYQSADGLAIALVRSTIPATVTLGKLQQLYDGFPKSVTTTTDPAGLAVVITYNGQATPPSNPNSYQVTATITEPGYEGSASATLVIALSAYDSWAILAGMNPAGSGAPKEDHDRDGLANLIEFALGLDPAAPEPDRSALPTLSVQGENLIVTFTRIIGPQFSDLSSELEWSLDPTQGSWVPALAEQIVLTRKGSSEIVTATIPIPPSTRRLFARLKVSKR